METESSDRILTSPAQTTQSVRSSFWPQEPSILKLFHILRPRLRPSGYDRQKNLPFLTAHLDFSGSQGPRFLGTPPVEFFDRNFLVHPEVARQILTTSLHDSFGFTKMSISPLLAYNHMQTSNVNGQIKNPILRRQAPNVCNNELRARPLFLRPLFAFTNAERAVSTPNTQNPFRERKTESLPSPQPNSITLERFGILVSETNLARVSVGSNRYQNSAPISYTFLYLFS